MKGNTGLLGIAAVGLAMLGATAAGAHVYRWEIIVWLCIFIMTALIGFYYSRRGNDG